MIVLNGMRYTRTPLSRTPCEKTKSKYKEDTMRDMLESERVMVLNGREISAEIFISASEFNFLLNKFVESIHDSGKFIFVGFLSQVRKHHTLAPSSSVRRHHAQARMNLHTIEAGAWPLMQWSIKSKKNFVKQMQPVFLAYRIDYKRLAIDG